MAQINYSSGCKVAWVTYDNRDEATARSKLAQEEAKRQWELGYDFGYQQPGSVQQLHDEDGNLREAWEVCLAD